MFNWFKDLSKEICSLYIGGDDKNFCYYSIDIYKNKTKLKYENRELTFIEALNESALCLDQYLTNHKKDIIIETFLSLKNTKLNESEQIKITYYDFSPIWRINFIYNGISVEIKERCLKEVIRKINSLGVY